MRVLPAAIAAAASLLLVGCLGGGDEPAQQNGDANRYLPDCPGGEEPRAVVFDLGENPRGVPTPRGAVARFLRQEKSDLSADVFERTDRGSGGWRRAAFAYSRDGSKLVQISLERLERGWLVVGYAFCPGTL